MCKECIFQLGTALGECDTPNVVFVVHGARTAQVHTKESVVNTTLVVFKRVHLLDGRCWLYAYANSVFELEMCSANQRSVVDLAFDFKQHICSSIATDKLLKTGVVLCAAWTVGLQFGAAECVKLIGFGCGSGINFPKRSGVQVALVAVQEFLIF